MVATCMSMRMRGGLFFAMRRKFVNRGFQGLWAILETGIIKSKNLENIFDKLHVITFNYDRILEQFLFRALQQAYHLPGKEAATIINATLDINHEYGQVSDLPWRDKEHGFAFGRKAKGHDFSTPDAAGRDRASHGGSNEGLILRGGQWWCSNMWRMSCIETLIFIAVVAVIVAARTLMIPA